MDPQELEPPVKTYATQGHRGVHRGKMHCARAVFLLLVNAPLLKTIGKNNKLGFRPRILKNLSSRRADINLKVKKSRAASI